MKKGKMMREFKQGWEVKTIGDICKVIAGQSPEGKYYNSDGNGLAFYQGKKDYGEKYLGEPTTWTTKTTKEAEANDILMSVRAPVGPINFATQKICIGRGLAAIRASELIDREFLFNFLLKHESEIVGNSGAVFNSINKAQIEAIQIPLPPLPEQQRIVAILDEAFAAIAKAKANAELNLQNAKQLFESYLQGVFENKGEGWEEKTFIDVCEITSKLIDPRESKYQNFIHIGAGNIESEKGTLVDLKTAKEENLISGKFLFDETMVLYSKIRPYLMKVVKCDFKGLCSADIYPLVPIKNKITKDFLYHLLLTKDFTDYAILGSQRAGMPKVNREHLFAYRFNLPPLKTQQTIVKKLDALSAETKKLEAIYQQKLIDLEELKKSILQKAFNGEL
jgi:type I restriction enzyme S subunit